MQFRHEVKHEISNLDKLILRQRLSTVMTPDSHAKNGHYEIRSLYFDNPDDKALREKLDGVSIREKYRIRLYNNDPDIQVRRARQQGVNPSYAKSGTVHCQRRYPLDGGQRRRNRPKVLYPHLQRQTGGKSDC